MRLGQAVEEEEMELELHTIGDGTLGWFLRKEYLIKVTLVKPGLLILTAANIDNQLLLQTWTESISTQVGGGGECSPSRQGEGGPWHSLRALEDPPQREVPSASSEGKVCSLGQIEFPHLSHLRKKLLGSLISLSHIPLPENSLISLKRFFKNLLRGAGGDTNLYC